MRWLLFFAGICSSIVLANTGSIVPVVYVMFGALPTYLLVNIEMALRHNPVIVITDIIPQNASYSKATFVDLRKYSEGAKSFAILYKHMAKDKSDTRFRYELNCFNRWYILRDYMTANKIDRVFFGDSDTVVFANVTQAFDQRSNCSVVINLEHQASIHHWVAAGESSLWTLDGITAFCDFNSGVYYYNLGTIYLKYRDGSTVTDMSALWLWWVATHRTATGWNTGRPFQPNHCDRTSKGFCAHLQNKFDEAFEYAKKLHIPALKKPTVVCNGLDVVQRTVFDHQHGWFSGKEFSLNLQSDGVPTFKGLTGRSGGVPESFDEVELKRLESIPVRLLTLHYQGNSKEVLVYDVCRVLLLTGSKTIANPSVAVLCNEVQSSSGDKWPGCKPHLSDSASICV